MVILSSLGTIASSYQIKLIYPVDEIKNLLLIVLVLVLSDEYYYFFAEFQALFFKITIKIAQTFRSLDNPYNRLILQFFLNFPFLIFFHLIHFPYNFSQPTIELVLNRVPRST